MSTRPYGHRDGGGSSGHSGHQTSTFKTLRPSQTFTTQIFEGYKDTYGVGMPIMLTFSQPVTNRAAVERALQITTSKPVVGAWYWDNSQTLVFRPREYWPAHTRSASSGTWTAWRARPASTAITR